MNPFVKILVVEDNAVNMMLMVKVLEKANFKTLSAEHGKEALERAIAATQVMFGGSLENLRDADLEPLLADLPSSELERSQLEAGAELLELLQSTGLAKSKGEARRLVTGGGVYVNNIRASDPAQALSLDDLGTETMIVLRSGKKKYHIIRVK